MNKKINKGILGFLFLLAVGLVSALPTECYQESANVSTACGGLDTGSVSVVGSWKDVDRLFDGNWNSPAYASRNNNSYVYVTYSKPVGALSSSVWQLKADAYTALRNVTIPQACWDANPDKIMFQLMSDEVFVRDNNEYCWNGNSWVLLASSFSYDDSGIYEEAMIWKINSSQPSSSCDYFTGNSEFNLPQITSSRAYEDSVTHKMYLACLYNLDGDTGYENMIGTQNCRIAVQEFNPSSEGAHTYKLAIAYRERGWNQVTHQWETLSEGTDKSLEYNFNVCSVPNDAEGLQSFTNWVSGLFCSIFGLFCA